MKLSRHFKLQDFIHEVNIDSLQRISRNILDPIQQRFGKVIINKLSRHDIVAFKVEGYKNDIIREYIEENLIHSFVAHSSEWLYVQSDEGE